MDDITPAGDTGVSDTGATLGAAVAAAAPAAKPPRKQRADKGVPKAKGKAKIKAKTVKIPVMRMNALVVPVAKDENGQVISPFTIQLKALNHSDAIAEVMKAASTDDKANAEKMCGARVELVALVDVFTVASTISVKVEVKR